MRTLLRIGVLVLALAAAPVLRAGPEDEDPAARALTPPLAAALDRALEAGTSAPGADDLHRVAILEHGDVAALIARVAALASSEAQPAARRHAARWVQGHLLRRSGRLAEALVAFQALAAEEQGVAGALECARLHDALGRARAAWNTWAAALPKIQDPAQALDVRVRMALLGRTGGASVKKALADVVTQDGLDPALRNRAAIVLALKGHPKDARALFVSQGSGRDRFREQVRLADWALAAKDPAGAQEQAWAAYRAATLKRDRRFALTVLVEAHRVDASLQTLIDRLAGTADLDDAGRGVWIDLLRETGQVDEALRLFRAGAEGRFTVDMRRELLELCRESGQEDVLVEAYREMISAEPAVIEWREGLSRHYLERGQPAEADGLWDSYLEDDALTIYLLAAAGALQGIGMDERAQVFAEAALSRGQSAPAALLFLFQLHKRRGRMDVAEEQLERLDAFAAPTAAARLQLAEAYEQLGKKKRAVAILEALRTARGPAGAGEDLEMHLAWLHSEVGDEDRAMERWHALWQRIQSVPRRRYVEDRLMSVAARLGKLADIAIELEEKLAAGTADARDSGLLVRLYTKAGDPVSATEIVEEHMKSAGAAPVKVLMEKSRVFLACTDYHNYEKTIHTLIDVDPEGKGDYLRQLAMSQLERGKPDEARAVLIELKTLEAGSDSAEFEAGVLALAGLREEAVAAYRRGIAQFPDRIESLLLMADQMAQIGQADEAIGVFQHVAETAQKDDLFTVAMDGLLNLDAPAPVLRWARRQALGRLARRHDKMYLYQLIADMSEELGEADVMVRALEAALPIIGERRSSLLRELMDHTKGPRGNRGKHLSYGRRLIGLGEIAPPQVYLDLGQAFLANGEVKNAAKTFSLATELPDWGSFQQQVATAFEQAGYREEALRTYQRLLVSTPGDVAMLLKVAELQEQVGRDDLASGLYRQAMDLMIARRPLSTVVKEKPKRRSRYYWMSQRNVDDFDQFYQRVLVGLLTTLPAGDEADVFLVKRRAALAPWLAEMRAARTPEEDEKNPKQAVLRAWPRIEAQARLLRRVGVAFGRVEMADELDRELLRDFPADADLLKSLVQDRLTWGLAASARRLIAESGRPAAERRTLSYLIGGDGATAPGLVSLLEANRLFLPLMVGGEDERARALLRRLDFSRLAAEDQDLMPVLQSAALQMRDGRLALALGRHWIKVLMKRDKAPDAPYRFRPVLQRIQVLLSEDEYRSLCEYVVALILEDPKQAGNWLQLIPDLQRSFEKPLLDDEQRKELLDKLDGNRWYWIGSFFALVPPEGRGPVLRSLLPRVPGSRRMQFLITLVEQIKEDIEGDFADLVVQSLEEALENLDANDQFAYYTFLNLARGTTNLDLRLRMSAVPLGRASSNVLVRAAHAVLLKKAGREDEGVRKAIDVLDDLFGAKRHYTVNTARNMLLDAFLPNHIDAFLAAVDKRASAGPGVDLTSFRLDLVRRRKDTAALTEAYRKAVSDHPANRAFKDQLFNILNGQGRYTEAIEVLEGLIAERPDDLRLQRRLLSLWQRLRHTVKVLAVTEEIRRIEEAQGEASVPKAKTWVTLADVKKAMDAGDEDAAATVLRRLWRQFRVGSPRGGRAMYYVPSVRTARMTWPVRRASRPVPGRMRGGLGTWVDEDDPASEPQDAYEVLAGHAFGRSELGRLLRTWTGEQLSAGGTLVDGVATGIAATEGAAPAVARLLGDAKDGRAGKREFGILLSLFESAPDDIVEDARPVLVELERTLSPTDVSQLLRLARVWVRLGDMERAARIYRWCGTRASAGGVFSWGARGVQPVQARDLIREVAKTLTGQVREDTIEAILAMSEPGDDPRFGPQVRDGYESLVLQTWIDLLGPEQALVRCRALCEGVAGSSNMPRRSTAMLAAGLFARAGEVENAVACLEAALCKLAPPPGLPTHMHFWFNRAGRMSRPAIRRLFPVNVGSWPSARAWLERVAEVLPAWAEAERLEPSTLVEPLAILMLRLDALEARERAVGLLPTLRAWAGGQPRNLLWVIDVARRLGKADEADALERALFDENQLTLERLADVVGRIREKEGPAAALEAGARSAALTRHPGLLKALLEAAKASGDPEALAHWTKVQAETKAAEQRLRELAQARKAAADKRR